jgi:ribonuclease HI
MTEIFRDPNRPRLFSPKKLGLRHARPSEAFFENPSGTFTFLASQHTAIGVFVDGACPGNGTSSARGGYGVFFGSNSRNNVSKPLKSNSPQTSQRAELMAVLVALHQIERIVSEYNDPSLDLFVILTDSAYLVNSLTSYIYKWRQNDYTASTGREVVNRDLFERLDNKLNIMANGRQGIDVLFWKVDRSENIDADALARRGAVQ